MRQLLKLRREALTVALFSGLNMLLGLVGNRLLTQFIGPEPLGELYLLMNLAQWLTVPTAAGYLFVVRHWQVAQLHGAARRFSVAILRALAVQAALALVGTALFGALHLGGITWKTAALLFLVCLLLAAAQAFEPVQQMERRRVTAGVVNLLGTPMRPFILILAPLIWVELNGERLLEMQILSSAILALATLGSVGLLVRSLPDRPGTRSLSSLSNQLSLGSFLVFSIPSLFANVMTQASASAERWGLAKLVDPASTAIFVQAAALSMALTGAVVSILNAYYYPLITGAASSSEAAPLSAAVRPLRSYLLSTVLLLGLETLAFALFARPITHLLFGPKFSDVARLLPWTMLGAGFFQLAQGLAIVSMTAREMIGKNASVVVSRAVYLVVLLLAGAGPSAAVRFSRIFSLGHGLYLIFMVLVCAYLVRREQTTARLAAGTAPDAVA